MRIEGVSNFGQTMTLLVPYRNLLRRLYCMVKGRVYTCVCVCVCSVFDWEPEAAKSH